MKVDGRAYRTIWLNEDGSSVDVIDQRWLPHEFKVATLTQRRRGGDGDPRHVGARGAADRRDGGLWARARHARGPERRGARRRAREARRHAADRDQPALGARRGARAPRARSPRMRGPPRPTPRPSRIADEDVEINRAIGAHGLKILRRLAADKKPGEPVNILTHCNAGWLATVDYGTATAPIYLAMDEGVNVHVYVDETRPRNQGASLTAWELAHHGAPHTLIVDNAGGHLMQHGLIDMVIVGTDRTTASGDVCNKIGTYLKALAARDNAVPFYVALPSPTIDWTVRDGVKEIPIEERSADEVNFVQGQERRRRDHARQDRAGREPRGQSRVRRHPGPSGDRAHHRARSRGGVAGGAEGAVSGTA